MAGYKHSGEPVDSVLMVGESSVQEVETAGYCEMLRASHSRRPFVALLWFREHKAMNGVFDHQ